jgi:hypothetical protein
MISRNVELIFTNIFFIVLFVGLIVITALILLYFIVLLRQAIKNVIEGKNIGAETLFKDIYKD